MADEEINLKGIPTIPDSEAHVRRIDPEEANKKPHWMSRFAGGLIDLCILFMSVFGLYNLELSLPISDYYKSQQTIMVDESNTALLESGLGYKVYTTDENYKEDSSHKIYEDETGEYVVYTYTKTELGENYDEAKTAYNNYLKEDVAYINARFNAKLVNYGLCMLAGAVAEAIFLLLVPLLNKRRATIGKLASGTMLISYKYQSRAKWYQILIRFFWILIVESAIPLLYLSEFIIPLVVPAIMVVVMLISRKTHRTIHDYVSGTMVIDYKTFLPLSEQ